MAYYPEDETDIETPAWPSITKATEAAKNAAGCCDEARRSATTPTSAALEAAARCVAARDDAWAAASVARKPAAGPDVALSRRTAAREAADYHQAACGIAATAALEALEASVKCSAAYRHAVAAALAAREAADRCHVAGGEAGAVAAARRAADLCVVASDNVPAAVAGEAATANRSVSRADAAAAAALAARKAVACCDAARADAAGDDDQKFLDNMRGWLMTVAALLVNMTFQAVMHPPGWMPLELVPSPGRIDGRADRLKGEVLMACIYLSANLCTFAVGLTVIVMLLAMKKAPPASTLKAIRRMMVGVAIAVACSFASGTAKHPGISGCIFGFLSLYAFITFFFVRARFYNQSMLIGKFF